MFILAGGICLIYIDCLAWAKFEAAKTKTIRA